MKILLYTDLKILPSQLFWHRDLGLLTKAFRNLGHEACLIVHPAQNSTENCSPPTKNQPVIWASPSDVRNPFWWKNRRPDLVILGLWTRPKYNSVRRAARSATYRIVERADSDGFRTASSGFFIYLKRRFDYFRDRTQGWPNVLSSAAALAYSAGSAMATPWLELRLLSFYRLISVLLVETDPALQRWSRLENRLGLKRKIARLVPHPIQTNLFFFDPQARKENLIISVGRWEAYQKNLPLLLRVLCAFFEENADWRAEVVGSGVPQKSPHPRITFLGVLTPGALAKKMRRSKVFLSSSRFESFGLAGAEAGACGNIIAGAHPMADFPAETEKKEVLLESLRRAVQSQADPEKISRRFSGSEPCRVARAILGLPF